MQRLHRRGRCKPAHLCSLCRLRKNNTQDLSGNREVSDCQKTCPVTSIGGKDSVKGNRQGSLSRSITRLQCSVSWERTICQALCAPRTLRVVQRTYPVGRDPCIPPFCSCHSEFVGADDSVHPRTLAWESAFPKRGADCRVAALLAMTDFFDSLRGGALPCLCCFAGAGSRKCNSCRNTLHETV